MCVTHKIDPNMTTSLHIFHFDICCPSAFDAKTEFDSVIRLENSVRCLCSSLWHLCRRSG